MRFDPETPEQPFYRAEISPDSIVMTQQRGDAAVTAATTIELNDQRLKLLRYGPWPTRLGLLPEYPHIYALSV